jgi:catechol O-methyltransferase
MNQDGRETDLLHYVFGRPDIAELRGNPSKVLGAIDEYSQQHNGLMNIGGKKGAFICSLIAEHKPSVMIELGGYVGYSAILFGDAVRANGGKQYLSLELNPEMAAVANTLIDLAGLRDFVRVIIGPCNESLIRLVQVEKTKMAWKAHSQTGPRLTLLVLLEMRTWCMSRQLQNLSSEII